MNRPLLTTLLLTSCIATTVTLAQRGGPATPPSPELLQLRKDNGVRNATVHDPSTIVQCGDWYYTFYTGGNCPAWKSKDLINWTNDGAAFQSPPEWVPNEVPNFRGGGFWAPDVIKVKDKYLLYFSASAFGVNTSTIGVATNSTLDKSSPDYKWTQQGSVVTSRANDDYNAIDPACFLDDDGRLWIAFGSFWSGIQLIECDPNTGLRLPNTPLRKIAHWDSIEGAYIYKHEGKYFLFVSQGMCCRGANSTYNTRVGRSDKVTGPYVDKEGKDLLLGGGSPFLATTGVLIGPGHAGIIKVGDKYWYSCHYESSGAGGPAILSTRPLTWDAQGWPVPQKAD